MGSNPLYSSTDYTLSEQGVEECLHVREVEKIRGKWVTICSREGLLAGQNMACAQAGGASSPRDLEHDAPATAAATQDTG